jgi:acetylornithine deacetylase
MLPVQIDQEYLIQTLINLVKINSINPSLVSNGAGEKIIAAYVADSLHGLGFEVERYEPQHGRVSVVGLLKGTGGGRSLMLNAHTDTVGIDHMPAPFSAEIRDGKLYGRGAYDMKGSLAACLAAAKALSGSDRLKGDVLIAAVADEEYASLGTEEIVKHYKPAAAIVTEPTELTLCIAHKGFVWIEVETIGRAAHGSRFALGLDANMRMGRFLAELDRLEQALRKRVGHVLVGPPSLHAAKIEGGTEPSMYAARCVLQIERRTIPGESTDQVLQEIQTIIDQLTQADPTFKASIKSSLARDSFEVSRDAAIVRSIDRAVTQTLGHAPEYTGVSFWMDSALLAAAGIETAVIGPIGAGAHASEEWVDLQSVEDTARILQQTAIDYCG